MYRGYYPSGTLTLTILSRLPRCYSELTVVIGISLGQSLAYVHHIRSQPEPASDRFDDNAVIPSPPGSGNE